MNTQLTPTLAAVDQPRLVRRCVWFITNTDKGHCTIYHAAHGIPVTREHVEASPSVLRWANGDPFKVFAPND